MKRIFVYVKAKWMIIDGGSGESVMYDWRCILPPREKVWNTSKRGRTQRARHMCHDKEEGEQVIRN